MSQPVPKPLTDLEIAQQAKPKDIYRVAEELGISSERLFPFGKYIAKVEPLASAAHETSRPKGRLILVTAMSPTKAGEGKTTVTVGLGDALRLAGKKVCIALREPSMGPVFGVKGGAAGGGWSQVVPMEDLNLHFTGDIHSVTAAHNLITALLENHLYRRLEPRFHPQKIAWHRVLDMNDRSLRNIITGTGEDSGSLRRTGFSITAASEVMAILCLAKDLDDLKTRLGEIYLGESETGEPIRVKDLGFQGAAATVLHRAIHPNLVQTLAGTPVMVHGGPFANIAHGTNSTIAHRLALDHSEITVTEAGFGADLGGQKFLDLVGQLTAIEPQGVVVVATLRAIQHHGQGSDSPLTSGLSNLVGHLENLRDIYGLSPVVALNRFPGDRDEDLTTVLTNLEKLGFSGAVTEVWAKGGEGGAELAQLVLNTLDQWAGRSVTRLCTPGLTIVQSIERIAQSVYKASRVEFSPQALKSLERYDRQGYSNLPVCIAKTQYSFSHDPNLLGRPQGFTFPIRDITISSGAGFAVALAGDMMTMPGLSKKPAALAMDIDQKGVFSGLF